jgi:hypothetical protein
MAGAETDEFPREHLPMSIVSTQTEYLALAVPAHLDAYQLLSENTRDYLMNGSTAANNRQCQAPECDSAFCHHQWSTQKTYLANLSGIRRWLHR